MKHLTLFREETRNDVQIENLAGCHSDHHGFRTICAGADRAEMGPRPMKRRAIPHRVCLGCQGNRKAHRRSLQDRRIPSLAARQRGRHQPGPETRHRRYHHFRLKLCRTRFQADRVTYFPYIFRNPEHLIAYTKSDVFKRLAKAMRTRLATLLRRSAITERVTRPPISRSKSAAT